MIEFTIRPRENLALRGLLDPENPCLLITDRTCLELIRQRVVHCPPTTFQDIERNAHPVPECETVQALIVGERVKGKEDEDVEANFETHKLNPISWSVFFALLCAPISETKLQTRNGKENYIQVGVSFFRVMRNPVAHCNRWTVLQANVSNLNPRPGYLMVNPVLVEV